MKVYEERMTNLSLSEIATFIIAGHETSSSSLAWTLYALAIDHSIQKKLRDEMLAFPHDSPSSDELNSLTYLDCVVKESLRRYGPSVTLSRMALQDMVVPLDEPLIDKEGNSVHELL